MYLAQTEVIFAVLFGSYAGGTADESPDIEITLRFPDELSEAERFRRCNRIDADLQAYTDVSDIEFLPTHVAHAALQDGAHLVGDQEVITTYKQYVDAEYDADASERDQGRRVFITF